MIHDQQMTLPRAFVHPSSGDAIHLEPSVRDRNVAVLIAMPDVDGWRDVLETKAPIRGEEVEVLCRCPRAGRGGPSVVLHESRFHLWTAEHLDIARGELSWSSPYCHFGPPTNDVPADCKRWIDQVLGPAGQSNDSLVEAHHSVFGTGLDQRSHSTHDACTHHPIGEKPSTDGGMRTSARNPDNRERVDVQVVGKAADVRSPVRQPAALLKGAVSVSWAVHRDKSDFGCVDRLLVE